MASVLLPTNRERLLEHADVLRTHLPENLQVSAPPTIDEIISRQKYYRYFDCLAARFQQSQRDMLAAEGEHVCDTFNRLILAQALGSFDPTPFIPPSAPKWLLDNYVARANFISERIVTAPPGEYTAMSDHLVKDLRILGGVSFPNFHNVIDWQAHLRHDFYLGNLRRLKPRNLWIIVFRTRGLGPFLRPHIDMRFLELRKQLGPGASRPRIAQLMRCCPEILGTTGSNWMHDPELEWVSPHLYEGSAIPRANGAVFVRRGISATATERALRTSKRRRKLYEEGRYQPREWTMIWPRKNILAWYATVETEDGAQLPAKVDN